MEVSTKKNNLKNLALVKQRFITDRYDFFLLSLSITSGLLIFTLVLYVLVKISSLSYFQSSETTSNYESLDNLNGMEELGEIEDVQEFDINNKVEEEEKEKEGKDVEDDPEEIKKDEE